MISIFISHIVEFRNGESGLHVMHINIITGMMLQCLLKKTDRYQLSKTDISLITTASALHDIGKISVPDEILNKPGTDTAEEFEIMKGHSMTHECWDDFRRTEKYTAGTCSLSDLHHGAL